MQLCAVVGDVGAVVGGNVGAVVGDDVGAVVGDSVMHSTPSVVDVPSHDPTAVVPVGHVVHAEHVLPLVPAPVQLEMYSPDAQGSHDWHTLY